MVVDHDDDDDDDDDGVVVVEVEGFGEFEDYFPSMIRVLGAEGFMVELCNGFCLLMDVEKGLITLESLKRNSLILGLNEMRDDEIVCMLAEGDLDGDGALNQMEFCILMFRISPALMEDQSSLPTTTTTTSFFIQATTSTNYPTY